MNNEILIEHSHKKTRFSNLILDIVSFWVLWILHGILFENWIKSITGEGSVTNNIIYFFVFYFLYYFIMEFLFGRTIGKFLTEEA
ncbi:hypothetical protein AEQU2_00934 [Aequorivita lipolytica]|uniref:RDD family protein n=1 Tax=Aequorivita lipolytica TaxID=153267 RepID=A0A5C6YSV0_9FLAO|nr:RDD family protein [Aequorivita lipolytica]TXD70055.1 hypothetical protein ESV24_02470 [Aequorivita lipolytica]SRX50461.1 hypothetical protein AEQU2_00934 [Aequorivita lipolytica]